MVLQLQCGHESKKFRMKFSCEVTGDYEVLLCEDCHKTEDRKFLISEKEISEGDDNA